ncbi:hypothetical protein FQZ97_1242650 [compost metagenome]
MLPFGLMSFYAFVSHSIPRYMSPAHPIMLILLVAVVVAVLNGQFSRRPSHVVAAA